MASGYKVNGVDLDDILEPRNGRTPLAPNSGYKVGGVDLADRYLSSSHFDAIVDYENPEFKNGGVPVLNRFAAKVNFNKIRLNSDFANNPWHQSSMTNQPGQLCVSKDGNYIATTCHPTNTGSGPDFRIFIFNRTSENTIAEHSQIWFSNGKTYNKLLSMDQTGSRIAITRFWGTNGLLNPDLPPGQPMFRLNIYRQSGTSWIEEASIDLLTPSGTIVPLNIYMNHSGDRVFVTLENEQLAIYRRNSTTWTEEQVLYCGYGAGVASNSSGSIVAVGDSGASWGYLRIFNRSGTTWTSGQLIGNLGNIGAQSVSMSSDGKNIAVSKSSSGGSLYHYTESGGTWSLNNSLIDDGFIYAHSGNVTPRSSVAISDSGKIAWAGTPIGTATLIDTPLSPSKGRTILKSIPSPQYSASDIGVNRNSFVAAASDFSTIAVASPLEWNYGEHYKKGAVYVYFF